MRILSDFDGVLTAQDEEAAAVGERLLERAAEAVGGDRARAQRLLEAVRSEVRRAPERHGWFVGEEIGCYADEDPYVFNNAVCRAIYVCGHRELSDAFRAAGFEGHDALSTACFNEGTARYREAHGSHVLEEALGAIQTFFSGGAEIVVVSNSSTARIQQLLEKTGVLRWGAGKVRIRGDARKFHVTSDRPAALPASLEFGGRRVLLRRGSYFDILREELPDVVIGDVLSLDVALPAALRARVPEFAEMDVVLKLHPHTPGWAREACAQHGIRTVDSFAKLPALMKV